MNETDPAAVGAHRNWCGQLPPRRRLLDAIGRLTAEERTILSRAYGSGWTVDEIAERQCLSREVVRGRLHDALRHLLVLTDGHGSAPDAP
jgi:DNA-directed RNA polymerase specialized sigma24 family protein